LIYSRDLKVTNEIERSKIIKYGVSFVTFKVNLYNIIGFQIRIAANSILHTMVQIDEPYLKIS
jgi:hypothetical protein